MIYPDQTTVISIMEVYFLFSHETELWLYLDAAGALVHGEDTNAKTFLSPTIFVFQPHPVSSCHLSIMTSLASLHKQRDMYRFLATSSSRMSFELYSYSSFQRLYGSHEFG